MGAYSSHRRPEAVPSLKRVSYAEATSDTDRKRQVVYEQAREAIADELRRQTERPKKSFAALVKKK